MAKQTGPLLLSGSLGGITFYNVDGTYYARSKKRALSKYRFNNSPSLEATRRNASLFALAQEISQELYRALPSYQKSQKKVWYPLRNKAQELFRQGKEPDTVRRILVQEVLPLLLSKVFKERGKKEREKSNGQEEYLYLGRYSKAVDNLSLLSELSAATILVRNLLGAATEKGRPFCSDRKENSLVKRQRLRG